MKFGISSLAGLCLLMCFTSNLHPCTYPCSQFSEGGYASRSSVIPPPTEIPPVALHTKKVRVRCMGPHRSHTSSPKIYDTAKRNSMQVLSCFSALLLVLNPSSRGVPAVQSLRELTPRSSDADRVCVQNMMFSYSTQPAELNNCNSMCHLY